MRERDRRGGWQQLLTLMGIDSIPEEEWEDIRMSYQLSWDRKFYIKLGKRASVGAVAATGPNPIIKRRDSTAPGGAVASSHGKRSKTMSPSSAPVPSSIKRRNSLAPPSFPTKAPYSKGQPWDSLCCTPKRRNSMAVHGFDTVNHSGSFTNLLLSPIKRRDSVIPAFDAITCNEFIPITPISPIRPIKRSDSVVWDHAMDRKESGTPLAPSPPKSRDSSVPASARAKSKSSKPLQKPISVVKHVTGSGDELDDEQMLADWKKYCAQRRAWKTKPSGSLKNGLPPQKVAKDVKIDPPVKRKRGRPSREEVAKRLEQEQALKMMNQTSDPFKELPKKQNHDWTKQEEDNDLDLKPDQKVEASPQQAQESQPQKQRGAPGAQQKPPKQEHQTPETPKFNKSPSKAPKQPQSAARPRCRSTSPVSDQGGVDIAELSNVAVQIIDEDAILPAHMPTMAIDLKCRSKDPSGDNEKEKEEDDDEDEDDDVRPKPNLTAYEIKRRHRRLMYRKILGCLSSDEDEELICNQTDFMFNDVQADEMLVDDAMELTSPVGGGEGDKDELDIDLDLDFHVRDENVANQIALIDTQEEMSFNRCLESLDTQTPSEIDQCLESFSLKTPSEIDECVETVTNTAPSEIHHQLTHASEFFEELPSRPPVNVSEDKSNLLWPFMDEDEVLDYEADYDVLTLVASSDELEDEAPQMPKAKSKPSEETEPSNQCNVPNARIEPPKPELQPKPIDKPEIAKPETLRTFRIPKLKPEVLKAQPAVMNSLYELEDQEQNRDKITERSPKTLSTPAPAVADDVRKKREEASAARRTRETNPKFGPLFRSVPVGCTPNFGPADLAPLPDPASKGDSLPKEPLHRHSREASQYVPENFVPVSGLPSNRDIRPEEPSSRHSREASQYVPENLTTSNRDYRPAKVSAPMRTPSYQGIHAKHWMMEVFGAKCLQHLDNKCLSVDCDHSMSSVGEVESRLFSMAEEALVHTYRQALRIFCIFGRYFKAFADIFERRNLGQHLLQMLANCRLYRATAVPVVSHIFRALQRCGMEREATRCIMSDLWFPDKAHKFRDLTLLILEILEAANWQDYIDQLMDLHKTHKFLLPDELFVRIIKWADATKNEALQKKAMMMLLDDMPTYARSTTLVALITGFSETSSSDNHNPSQSFIPRPDRQPGAGPGPSLNQKYPGSIWNHNPNPNLVPQHDRQPGAGPAAGQQLHYPASNWIHNPNPNLVSQHDRLPGAGPGPSLIQQHQYPAPIWNHNPNPNLVPQHDRLPGAGPAAGQQQQHPATYGYLNPNLVPQHDRLPGASHGPSLVQRCPAPGQQQQQYPASNWISQANNVNRADDNQYRQYPQGFP